MLHTQAVRDGVWIRVSSTADDRLLAALDAASWPEAVQVSPPQPEDEPFFNERREPRDVLVAVLNGEIVGYVRLGRHMRIPANDHVLHVDALVVSPRARGRGIGARLVAAAIDETRMRGVAKLGLRALSNNPGALRLYAAHGFVEEGRLHAELRVLTARTQTTFGWRSGSRR